MPTNNIELCSENTTQEEIIARLEHRNKEWVKKKDGSSTDNGSLRTVVLACIDSRVIVEKIFQAKPGELLVMKNAGNEITTDVLRSLLIAIYEIHAKFLIILGHTQCGTSIKGTDKSQQVKERMGEETVQELENYSHQNLEDFLGLFHPGIESIKNNISNQAKMVQEFFDNYIPVKDHPKIIQALYDVKSGEVTFLK